MSKRRGGHFAMVARRKRNKIHHFQNEAAREKRGYDEVPGDRKRDQELIEEVFRKAEEKQEQQT